MTFCRVEQSGVEDKNVEEEGEGRGQSDQNQYQEQANFTQYGAIQVCKQENTLTPEDKLQMTSFFPSSDTPLLIPE